VSLFIVKCLFQYDRLQAVQSMVIYNVIILLSALVCAVHCDCLGRCMCPGLLQVSWVVAWVLGCCMCPGLLHVFWVVACVQGCCMSPGLLSESWVVARVLGCMCPGLLQVSCVVAFVLNLWHRDRLFPLSCVVAYALWPVLLPYRGLLTCLVLPMSCVVNVSCFAHVLCC
jgi:hypothetical protein